MSLPKILKAAETAGSGLSAPIPEDWMQGRTGYGGLTAALAFEAARRSTEDLPPLRSAQISFVGPSAERAEVRVETLRRGRTAAFIEARVHSQGRLAVQALFVFQAELGSPLDWTDAPAPETCHPEDGEDASPPVPGKFFGHNFEYRFAAPKPDAPIPDLVRWVRLREREGLHPMTELLAIGDALPPAAMGLMTDFAPISSLSWMMNILSAEPSREGWRLSRSTADHILKGSSSQAMGLWSADRAPAAAGMQSVALFG